MKKDVVKVIDMKFHFMEVFDLKTGMYVRTGIIKDGKDTGEEPFMRSFPGLLDIGIMGGCKAASLKLCRAGGARSGCYQGARPYNPNRDMKLEDYMSIIKEGSKYGLMQVALGGAGNPNDHADFHAICKYTREHNIVPNYTTAGIALSDEAIETTKNYCGAVAVSWYGQPFTVKALNTFISAGCKTNIHYVLSKETLQEAITLLEKHQLPYSSSDYQHHIYDLEKTPVNAVIFLLYKPIGLGRIDNILSLKDNLEDIKRFFALVNLKHPFKVGFDSCSIPAILNFSADIDKDSIDTCEGARFSAYITADMIMTPCSFDQQLQYGVSLRESSILEAWNSKQFDIFRKSLQTRCPTCVKRMYCMGGCPLKNEIVLCNLEART